MTLTAQPSIQTEIGYFRVFAQPPGGKRREITIFRGAPVMVGNASFADPFSEQTCAIKLPQVTIWDNLGDGDLDWLVKDCDIDIVWQNTGNFAFTWRWEGFLVNWDGGATGTSSDFSITLKGCLYALDNYQAKPAYPSRPIPYERLIRMAFNQKSHPCRLRGLKVSFPTDWNNKVPSNRDPKYLNFLKPWGVSTGQNWTGFTSRSTGTWEPLLSGHVQSLLSVMFAEGGAQWTVRNRGGRRPELFLRRKPDEGDPNIIEIESGAPGVSLSISKDFTQSANVIYGSGQDDAGIVFNGMQVTPNGRTTYFKPFAYSPVAYPRTDNPNYDPNSFPRETMVQFQNGVSEDAAYKIAQAQLHRFNDPGITGSLTLQADARLASGEPIPRMLIKAGDTLRLKGLLGVPEGIVVHVTSSQADFTTLTNQLSIDSKYRDELTVQEVKARTKDALTPLRSLQVGKYSNTVQDLLMPWSYKDGSGCIPMGARKFFNEKLPSEAEFPYEEWTKKHPPKNPAFAQYYIKIGRTNQSQAKRNWSGISRDGVALMSIPIRMSQAGTIKLTQLAAYDKNGNVLPVKFHFSVYSNNGVAADAMPKLTRDPQKNNNMFPRLRPRDGHPSGYHPRGWDSSDNTSFAEGQPHPFFQSAWEKTRPDGSEYPNDWLLTARNAGLVVGWGNYYEPAGFWPGRFSKGAHATGLLSDSQAWSWDLNETLDPRNPKNPGHAHEYAGMLFVQIYCEDQGNGPVYFMGRLFRQEQGTST